ncbi:hypothetical protein NDS46_30140 (plasmid) [Paenibacillus thiaminolyticus]|uniref:hypothetical protein n=1 Tax=Paenibacillus thiaminolyticus TaxID=49283 RepID=UPI00232CBFA2|nr:hypothetical protein [Paenibacillus thiaminolyticus]WCF11608.1 hypothetical protein NDS46_30140 [Paenibacillus thiaminolyticus]
MYDAHIEFSHIYRDKPFSQEQIDSILITKKLSDEFFRQGKTITTSVMIDDYHIQNSVWSNEYLFESLQRWGYLPDQIVSERSFLRLSQHIISLIPDELKSIETFKKEKKKVVFFEDGRCKFALKDVYGDREVVKCVALSCAWMLSKLGIFPFPENSFQTLTSKKLQSSNMIITVLDKKYMPLEDKVITLIECLGYGKEKKRIQYYFY